MYAIRHASIHDIPLIRELTFQVWPHTYASILAPQQIDYMLDLMYSEASLLQQMQEGYRFIILLDDDRPAGFAAYQETEAGHFKLHKLYVLPSQQGKGSGRYIISYIISEMQARGAVSLQLQVNRNNKARGFYEKLGFAVIQEADFDIGHGFFMNDYIMEKKLD